MRYAIPFLLIAAACISCDPLANPVSGRLSFSSDTISFDTVFSGYGSATLELRVKNLEDDPLLIDRIWLGGGSGSPFRINIDGQPATEAQNVTLARDDSLFIFVIVTIDPTGADLPLAVTDSVNFISGSHSGRVILEAWGQDVRLVDEDILTPAVWTEGKPYVIRDHLLVDTLATLTLEPGTRVYMHHGAMVTVAGSLVAAGTAEKRITIATDRLEKEYRDVPGRWKGLRFQSCSHGNILNHTDIRNAEIAVRIDGLPSSVPDLSMNSTTLMHNTVASLAAKHADLFAVNSLFAHSGFSTVSLAEGGSYEFIHCTISNSWEYSFRSEPALLIRQGTGVMATVSVINSVVSGSLGDELMIQAPVSAVAAAFRADSSLIKVDTLAADWYSTALFTRVITTRPPLFIDENAWDFRPDTLSPLLDRAGKTEMKLWPADIRNKPRPAFDGPDIGAFERQGGEKRKEEETGMAGMRVRH
ncbi:MAG: hypothetical protein RBT28_07915 [Bacteroidales bacterium]|jgi:hypothetical protein|nr:hypothetical protein [Bacteroidales bacterium]